MKAHTLIGGALMALILGGCAHGIMRGSVAMKAGENEAHVCMGEGEVKVGDHVALFMNKCKFKGPRGEGGAPCEKVRLGEGSVTEVLNKHYSVVRFEPGVSFEEGTFVEKL